MKDNTYINTRHLYGFGTHVVGIIGARGIGKTYNTKAYCMSHYFYEHKPIIWLRDSENAIKELCLDDGRHFFDDIQKDARFSRFFEDADIKIESGLCKNNGNPFIFFLPCSTFYKFKGNSFSDYRTIVYDEFIEERTQVRRGNRGYEFINMIQSIGRLRNDYKIIMTANALDKGSTILQALDVNITGYGYFVNRKKDTAIWYCPDNPEYIKKVENSIAGKLVSGTEFADNIIHNSFSGTEVTYFDRRPARCKLWFIFKDEYGKEIRFDYKDGTVYCSYYQADDTFQECKFVTEMELVDVRHRLASKNIVDTIVNLHGQKKISFNNAMVFNTFLAIFGKKR